MNFSYHINNICSKLSKTIGILYNIIKFVPMSVLIKLYYGLIYPVIIYCIVLWGDASKTHSNSLVLFQKKIIRIITNSDYLSHTKPLFIQTGILSVPLIYKYVLGIQMFKLNSANLIPYSDHPYNTRNKSASVAFQRLTQTQKSISFCRPQLWNNILSDIRNSTSISMFKRSYKTFLLDSIGD